MKNHTKQLLIFLFLPAFMLLSGTEACADTQLTILVNTGPFSSVEEAAKSEEKVNWWDDDFSDDRACTECFAAVELSRFLPACTALVNDVIQLKTTESLPRKGDVILAGSRKSNALIASYEFPDKIRLDTNESFCIRAFQENNRTITIIEGRDRVGTLYGVYRYLEQLGIRFYGLGEKGTVYPDGKSRLPKALTITENPSFLTRGYHAWEDRGNEDFFLWMARNRMNFWTAAEKEIHFVKKLGMNLADGGHVIQMHFLNSQTEYPYDHPKFKGDEDKPDDPYAPGDEYGGDTNGDGKLTCFEAHPEWYGLRGGKRSDNNNGEFGDNYCTSNADATIEFAKNIIQSLIDGRYRYVDIFGLWMMDNNKWCECENCKKLGNFTDRLFGVIHIVNKEIRKAIREGRLKRNVQLSSLAYLGTIYPPTHSLPDGFDYDNFSMTFFPIERCYNHTLADPSCTEYNRRLAENYLAWTTGQGRYYTGTMFIGEYYNISYLKSMPMLYTRMMAADVPWYYQTGTRHFHYMHTPTRLWGTWTLNQYLLARLLWNADTDADDLLDEYFQRYYPTTCECTRSFYNNLEKGMESFKAFRYWGWKNSLKTESGEIFPAKHFHYEPYFPKTNDGTDLMEMREYMLAARKYIDAALLKCTDKTEKSRLLEDERRFAYGEAMFFFHYHLFRTAMFFQNHNDDMARREFDRLEQYAEKLRGIKELVQVSATHANAENGLAATQAEDLYKFFGEKYGE